VRALRIYERQGLIRPRRGVQGWRVYGHDELVRLNAIIALKNLGLTLAQIRQALSGSAPAIREVLQLQLEVWQRRRSRADEGLKLVRAALVNLEAREHLSMEDLCLLARSMDMSNSARLTRETINEVISPDEERAWMTYWAGRPAAEVQDMQAYASEQRALLAELSKLQASGTDVASPEVQRVAGRWPANISRYQVRDRMLAAFAWNAAVTRKWLNVGERVATRSLPTGASTDERSIWRYLNAALKASPPGQLTKRLISDTKALLATKSSANSPAAAALGQRLREICHDFQLGDAITYARWASCIGEISDAGKSKELEPADKAAWEFLIDALQVPLEASNG
jgi:DNA-binding transcriptional MerR regulator